MTIEEDLLCRFDENMREISIDNEDFLEYIDDEYSDELEELADEEGSEDIALQMLLDQVVVKRIPECISKYKHLEKLTLDHGSMRIGKIENLDGLTSLRVLDLTGNNIRKIENLDRLEGLEVLVLKDNGVPPGDCRDFEDRHPGMRVIC